MKLKHKIVLITGAGRGLGKGIAKAFADQGAKVVVNEREEKNAADTVAMIKGAGGDAIPIGADISSSKDVENMFAKAVEHYGTVDILINNAAITPSSDASRKARAAFLEMISTPIEKHSLEITKNIDDAEWNRIINVNLTGVFYCTREALKIMEAKKYGKIVNIASIAAVSGMSFHSPHYSASKAGVVGFTRSVALEVIGANVNVNCIACGGILTESWDAAFKAMGKETQARQLQMIPAGRMGKIEEYASLAVYLASDDAAYIVGQTINMNGGVVT
ncbi:3-oxoacyl-ACP reductase FabG [Bradyrhizobium sp. 61]|uniref:SDR family NAD(P)-dependent oxidoreductase n=1 Tax=unclassified Bradyrhizobium TaxID=2631580 RepID=UPI001FF741F5|nr:MULTISPECIES: 3-oxoacyl-ACP reductase family protein [unclassified Bradyrhizobium]MCK1278352.1 3-oxoacyl-ACP reductase FabG [Bradyrhizobium sp. 61]MCK1443682.1 3-oxoacyl-ACP reductase FabG [Bradyrhizobium sp. 48]MCK1461784.1 3-oxoacyl-ACP reductase FabG [Bradyrhizobium sp. 2]